MRSHVVHVVLLAALAPTIAAQSTPSSASARVSGIVYDSLAHAPLRGATVQLVAASGSREVIRSAVSAADGAFTLTDVPAGRYTAGFLHPLLDSLGIESPVRELEVADGDRLRADLSTPSSARMGVLLCGGSAGTAPAMQVGVIRSAIDDRPVAGAIVEGGWTEYAIRRGAIGRGIARVADTADAGGRYRLCDVPRGGTVMLRVARGAERSALIDVDVPASGVSRRDLYVGRGWTRTRSDAVGDTAVAGAGEAEIEVGDGVLRGRVLDREHARPIVGARVGIVGGHEARTDASGDWSLAAIPTGTRLLEVRAVGYAPTRIAVDVFTGAPPVDLRLATVGATLDTIRVVASRGRLASTGFEQRRRSSAGHFVTTREMLQRPIHFTSQVFETLPGLRADRTPLGETRITMRGTFTSRCSPAVYIDGLQMRDLSAEDIDAFISPDEIAGIEVYSEAAVPPEFNPGMTGCGSIVIWRKIGENPVRSWSWKRRLLHGAGAAVFGFGIGVVLTRT